MMTEGKIANDGDAGAPEERSEKRGDLPFVAAVLEPADHDATDRLQSTSEPKRGQHAVEPVRGLVDVFPEPDSLVDPEIVRRVREARR